MDTRKNSQISDRMSAKWKLFICNMLNFSEISITYFPFMHSCIRMRFNFFVIVGLPYYEFSIIT